MTMSIYLHKEVANVLKYYGNLDYVVNKILEFWEIGIIDIEDKPAAPPRGDATRYSVNITNEEYLELLQTYPPNSSKISLRRLLYWFVENDVFSEVDWFPEETVKLKDKKVCAKKLEDAEGSLRSILSKLSSSDKDRAQEIIEMLKELRNSL